MGTEEPECRELMPLSELPSGAVGIVESIHGGKGLLTRLSSMGLTIGAEFSVIQNALVGPVLINVRGVRLAIGRGMASRIFVKVKR